MWRLLALTVILAQALAQTSVSFWHTLDEPGRSVMEQLVGDFNANQREYKIEARYVGDLREGGLRLQAAIRSSGAPVIYYAEISYVARGVQEGLFQLLDSYMAGLPQDFYPGLLESGRLKGKTYALPVELHTPVLFYNADQLAAKRINVPNNWEELASAAQRLTTRASKGYIVSSDLYSFNALVMSRGGSLLTAEGRPNFTDPKVVASLEYLQALVRSGVAQSRNVAEIQFSVVDFLRTKASMVVAPISLWPIVEGRNSIPFKMGVAPLPRDGGKVPLAGGSLAVLRGANDAQIKGAVVFWRYLMEPASIARWVKSTYVLPMRRSALPLLEDFYKADPRRRVALVQLEDAKNWLQDPEVTLWYTFLEDALERALKSGAGAKQVLEDAQRKASSVERR
jgi:sn-glycerol 3-phosphate transport system substrate-binding protein